MEETAYPEGSAHFPASSIPAKSDCVAMIHTVAQECYKSAEAFSDDDLETFRTPPTSLTPTDDVSCIFTMPIIGTT